MKNANQQIQKAIDTNAVEFALMTSGHGSEYRFNGNDPNKPTPAVSYQEACFQGIRWIHIADTIGGDARIYHIPTSQFAYLEYKNPGVETKVISAFPGTGKTYFHQNSKDLFVLDSDSSHFSWLEKGVRNPSFPNNYINHIQDALGFADIVLVSSHDIVRDALVNSAIDYTLIFPDKSLKDEYVKRFTQRGSPQAFIDLLNANWETWISELEKQKGCTPVTLQSGQYLSDILIAK